MKLATIAFLCGRAVVGSRAGDGGCLFADVCSDNLQERRIVIEGLGGDVVQYDPTAALPRHPLGHPDM